MLLRRVCVAPAGPFRYLSGAAEAAIATDTQGGVTTVNTNFAGFPLSLQVGRVAPLASGAVFARHGGTTMLVTAVASRDTVSDRFLPLMVDYREKAFAGGNIPTSFTRREMGQSEREILSSRVIDRTIRPLFPDGYMHETQVTATLLSYDDDCDPEPLSILAASAALAVSDIPWEGPAAAVHVAMMDGQPVINPGPIRNDTGLGLLYSGTADLAIMLEAGADEASVDDMIRCMIAAQGALSPLIDLQHALVGAAGQPKRDVPLSVAPQEVVDAAYAVLQREGVDGKFLTTKLSKSERGKLSDELRGVAVAELAQEFPEVEESLISQATTKAMKACLRDMVLGHATADTGADLNPEGAPEGAPLLVAGQVPPGRRVDHRDSLTVRDLGVECDILPGVHGSSLFSRGATQSICTTTLGPPQSAQKWRAVAGSHTSKPFFLHYDFPPYCINETGRVGGINRRMVGHGALAEKAVAPVIEPTDVPFTIRVTSEVSGSDGSSSMASVCGASLSLMDAGVKTSGHVAGISVGLVTPKTLEAGSTYVLLTDILGLEDFFGDMDFKVAGTRAGITALQLDIKPAGLPLEILAKALRRANTARGHVLDAMEAVIAEPRGDTKPGVPMFTSIPIPEEATGKVIGTGGSTLRKIEAESGATVTIVEGTAVICGPDAESTSVATSMIADIVEVRPLPVVGDDVTGKVAKLMGFGAAIDLPGGVSAFLHVSEAAHAFVEDISTVVELGDEVTTRVVSADKNGRGVKVSLKALTPAPPEAASRANGGGGGGRPRRKQGGGPRGKK